MASQDRLSATRFPRRWRSDPTPRLWRPSAPLRAFAALCLWLWGAAALAEDIELNPSHPDRYTVASGDTLWDIAGQFLSRPWQWPQIWRKNPDIRNPDLIYPGDVLVLGYEGGAPWLGVETPSELRLSPQIRSTPIDQAIPTIPMNAVRQFLSRPQVVGSDLAASAPYVVAFADEHIVGGYGNQILVRAVPEGAPTAYTLLRAGNPYKDADTGELLGYEALYVGDARLEEAGDPATLFLERTELEARIGDRLAPFAQEQLRLSFQPHAPKLLIRGHIISVLNGVTQIGQYSLVALDRGAVDGLEVGHVLRILQRGKMIRDIVGSQADATLDGPEQKSGLLMVFRVTERVSFALIMHASRALHVLDIVQTP
jgi:hypothetical protein